jgi:hypothetical protein
MGTKGEARRTNYKEPEISIQLRRFLIKKAQ